MIFGPAPKISPMMILALGQFSTKSMFGTKFWWLQFLSPTLTSYLNIRFNLQYCTLSRFQCCLCILQHICLSDWDYFGSRRSCTSCFYPGRLSCRNLLWWFLCYLQKWKRVRRWEKWRRRDWTKWFDQNDGLKIWV